MMSFYSDMDEILLIEMGTRDSSDGSWESSSDYETSDDSSPAEAENVDVVEEATVATCQACANHDVQTVK